MVSAEVNSTDEIDFGETIGNDDEDNALGNFRQAHWYVESDRFGYLSIGQGDTAAEDTAHVDLSGTDLAGSGSDVDDIAGGLTFAADDGIELAELDDFFDMQDGDRALRVLYETPNLTEGLTFRASLQNSGESLDPGDDIEGDGLSPSIGVAYEREFGDGIEFAAEASWRREEEDEVDSEFIVGSASLLLENGLNFTFAASQGDVDDQGSNPTAIFSKIGYISDFFGIDETRLSLDYFNGENNPDFASPGGDLPGATSYGLFAVQAVDSLNTEFYVGFRNYELEGVYVDGDEKDVDNLSAFITGARVQF